MAKPGPKNRKDPEAVWELILLMRQGLSKNQAAERIAANKPYSVSWLKQEHVRLKEAGELPDNPPVGPRHETAVRSRYRRQRELLQEAYRQRDAAMNKAQTMRLDLSNAETLVTELVSEMRSLEDLATGPPDLVQNLLANRYPDEESALAELRKAKAGYWTRDEKVAVLNEYLDAQRTIAKLKRKPYPPTG